MKLIWFETDLIWNWFDLTSEPPYSLFFQHAIIFIIVLLIIYILWCVFSRLYSSYNEEKNLPNYKIPINRNYSYGFPIWYAEEPKDRTASYETLPYGYGWGQCWYLDGTCPWMGQSGTVPDLGQEGVMSLDIWDIYIIFIYIANLI